MRTQPDLTSCYVQTGADEQKDTLIIAIFQGELAPGLYDLRFAVVVESDQSLEELRSQPEVSRFAPMHWSVTTYNQMSKDDNLVCIGTCCPALRPNFLAIVGQPRIKEVDNGVLEAYPTG